MRLRVYTPNLNILKRRSFYKKNVNYYEILTRAKIRAECTPNILYT